MKASNFIFIIAMVLCLLPWVSSPVALLAGVVIAQMPVQTFPSLRSRYTPLLLQASVVGLGFGMNAIHAFTVGKSGLLLTIASISVTIFAGLFIGRRLKVEKQTALLISSGTAICGGSAIAAISSVIKADNKHITTALGTVFILNAVALFLFPFVGHLIGMSQQQFGLWAAIAIHDTSSVVGAASYYGSQALSIATTVKLERALWIIPFMFIVSYFNKGESGKATFPYFILWFVVAMLISTFIPAGEPLYGLIVIMAKSALKLTLFLVGTGLQRSMIKEVGIQPFGLGIVLWILISLLSLGYIVCMM